MQKQSAVVPDLNHDAMMFKKYGVQLTSRGRLERRIVANLIAHATEQGWSVQGVHDGNVFHDANSMQSAMELIFNLDDAGLYFEKGDDEHRVLIVLGNGEDIIGDWGYMEGDPDGFNEVMKSFQPSHYA